MSPAWRYRAVVIVLVLVLIALVVACGPPALKEGDVVSKRFDPAHDEMYWQQIYAGESCTSRTDSRGVTTRSCTPRYTQVPAWRWVEDRWYVTITDGDRKSERRVDETTYHNADEGEYLVIG